MDLRFVAVILFSVLTSCLCLSTGVSVNTYLTARDKEQLKNVLLTGLDSENLSDIFYAAAGLQQLDQKLPDVQVRVDLVQLNYRFDLYFRLIRKTWPNCKLYCTTYHLSRTIIDITYLF